MSEFTIEMKKMLSDEIFDVTKKINNDFINNLDLYHNKLSEQFRDINFGKEVCKKFDNLNKKAQEIQKDTASVCNELSAFLQKVKFGGEDA